ncbi:MAG: hypothetical protein EOP38_16825 [Rubrivivax sp.]|nr:MAG: hypothetical protein EOP38_16825 [Rubrivivax sp.]
MKNFKPWIVLVFLLGLWLPVQAAIDLAEEPLPTYVATKTKPNILFILDNSGSMGWDYMPDDVNTAALLYTTTYGYKSAQCNGVAYDPTYTYVPPLKADGTSYPAAVFTAAMSNGFTPKPPTYGSTYSSNSAQTTSLGSKTFRFTDGFTFLGFGGSGLPAWAVGTEVSIEDPNDPNHWMIGTVTNSGSDQCAGFGLFGVCLFGNSYRDVVINVTQINGSGATSPWGVTAFTKDNLTGSTYYNYTGTQTKMGWTYNAAGVLNTTFKNECISHPGLPSGEAGDGKFTGVVLTAASAEAGNYANWYQYYRTRMLMTRSGAGRAFQPLTNRYRIGFTTINDTDIAESSVWSNIQAGQAFLFVKDYDSAQRSAFFDRLYNTDASGGTPLRTALAKAGRYYAGKITGQTAGSYKDPVQYACQRNYAFLSTDGYWNDGSNPKQLNGTTDIGQQDSADVRPFSDGGTSTSSTVTTVTERRQTNTPVTVVQNYTMTNYTYTGSAFSAAAGCSAFSPIKRTSAPKTAAPSISGSRVEISDWTTTTTVTTTTTAGVQTSSSATSGPTQTIVSTTDPTAPAPTVWTAGATTTSCQGSLASTPATDGGPFASGAPSVTVTGSPVTVVLPPTTTTGPTTTVGGGSGGSSNTLSDVAEYYYKTDLRTSALGNCTAGLGGSGDICDNTGLSASGSDTALWQHMSTFTLGLGVNGTLAYDRYYLEHASVTTSDYYKINAGTLNWPAPVSNNVTTIDDLWHAAVNGRGQYFGAKNATDLTLSLSAALQGMGRTPGAGARPATTKNMASDSQSMAFFANYTTVDWTGNVTAYTVNTDGSYSDPLGGTAQAGVDNLSWRGVRTSDARNIKYAQPNSTTLKNFTYTNLNADGLGANFTNFCSKTMSDTSTVYPLQCAGLTAAQVTAANTGDNLVNYLRGYSAYEESNAANPLYRGRLSALGDIVNSAPTYVAAPSFNYSDSGYSAFKSAQAARKPMLYVGSNDGMLHAFSADPADRGTELWAFVPTAVMPKMARLANTDYANRHTYLVDGSPNVSDVKIGGVWKTILVGGLNGGGKSYYALDITNPASPQLLWEYFETATATALSAAIPATSKDADLGYTYGNPLVVKRTNGTWVVVFASGYNNTGNGYLYVLDAATGAKLVKIPTYTSGTTPAGTLVKPSGLSRIRAWVDASTDATAKRFYGGDLLGNVWRFDIDGLVAPTNQAQRLAYLQINATTPQPIMVRPELAEISYNSVKYPVVILGTGQYLGPTDLSTTTKQSIYAIKDPLTATDWGDVRASAALVNQVVTTAASGLTRTTTSNTVNWASAIGWRLDLETSKERIFANMGLQSGILLASSIIPGSNTCSASGGAGWVYVLDIKTGSRYAGTDTISFVSDPPMPGPGTNCNGKICFDSQSLGGGNGGRGKGPYDPPNGGGQTVKRTLWRELIN